MTLIKSISGIRGTIGGQPGKNLTPLDITEFAAAYAAFLKDTHNNCAVAVGRDGRVTGRQVQELVMNTLVMSGVEVYDLGLTTTPTVEMAVIQRKAQGGIIVSASHNPMNWNAMKFLNEKGEFLSAADGEQILRRIERRDFHFADHSNQGSIKIINGAIEDHVHAILDLDIIDVDKIRNCNFHAVIDPVNSSGALALPVLLERLGCTWTMINGEIEGRFNHLAEPKPENLTELCEKVRSSGANIGIAVDPDVDRLALVDERGAYIGEEYTLVLAADFILEHNKGATVSNLSSSRALADISAKYDCDYYASAVGEINVVEKMKAVDAVIGGEGNGGVIYPGLHYGRDGLLGTAFAMALMAEREQKLSELRESYSNYTIVKDKVDLVKGLDVNMVIDEVKNRYDKEELSTIDGLKIDFDNGWVHLRKSNTEPIIRIYAESRTAKEANDLINPIKTLVNSLI